MRKLMNILVGAWLSVGCVPMWSMHRLSPAPQEARDNAGTVQVCFVNQPEYCSVWMFYKQGKDNFSSKFQVPFHPNIMTDRPFFEKNLQSIVDILQKDGEPITNERWGTLVQVLEHGLDEGQVQQDSVTSAGGGLPDDKVKNIVDLYNDMLDQIRTFIVGNISEIATMSNGSDFTTYCCFSGGLYKFSLPLVAKEDAVRKVARAMSRFVVYLKQQRDEAISDTIDPITQKICNKMARPRFVAKSPEQQTRILRRAIRMILIDQGHSLEESSVLSSGIVDQWSQLKEQLNKDVTWKQDSDYHVDNVEKGQKFVAHEGKVRDLAILQDVPIDDNTPVRTSVRGPRTEYVKPSISGGVSTNDHIRFVQSENPYPYFLDAREYLKAELGEAEVMLEEAEKKGAEDRVRAVKERIQSLNQQLYGIHVRLPESFHRRLDENYRAGGGATTRTDVPDQESTSPFMVRYGLPMGYKF